MCRPQNGRRRIGTYHDLLRYPNHFDTLRSFRYRPGRLRVAAHNLGEPLAVRPRVLHELFLLVSLDPLERFAGRVDLSGQL